MKDKCYAAYKTISLNEALAISKEYGAYKTISLNEALAISKEYGKQVSLATLIKWVEEHVPKLGHQPGGSGGRWYIFKEPFIAFISGQEALCNELLDKISKGE